MIKREELPAYRTGVQLWAWCAHERRWHYHGACGQHPDCQRSRGSTGGCTCPLGTGNGHRTEHCSCPHSPYNGKGYYVVEIGPLTPEVLARPEYHVRKTCICYPFGHQPRYDDFWNPCPCGALQLGRPLYFPGKVPSY